MTSPEISTFLQERIDANDFPSAVYLVAEKGEIVFQDALGFAVVEPAKIPATTDTIYDLASLTKPLVTGILCAKSIENKQIELGRTTDYYMPEFRTAEAYAGAWDTSVAELLTHTSLFQSWKPLYLFAEGREEILAEIVRTPMKLDGEDVLYSDLNFIVLMYLLERTAGERIDAILDKEIVRPGNLRDTFFNPPAELRGRTAASEKGNGYEKQTCVELGYLRPDWTASIPACPDAVRPNGVTFRDYQIWGEVHDGNAWFMGGVAGHAGLFSTAEETFRIAQQFLPNYTTLLKPETCELFRTNFTPGMNEHRSFAFQLASTPESTAGTRMSPEAFGHLGFTGTSLWIDPVKERVFILLTNRTHAHSLPFTNINSVRRRFHDLANDLLDKLSN